MFVQLIITKLNSSDTTTPLVKRFISGFFQILGVRPSASDRRCARKAGIRLTGQAGGQKLSPVVSPSADPCARVRTTLILRPTMGRRAAWQNSPAAGRASCQKELRKSFLATVAGRCTEALHPPSAGLPVRDAARSDWPELRPPFHSSRRRRPARKSPFESFLLTMLTVCQSWSSATPGMAASSGSARKAAVALHTLKHRSGGADQSARR